MAPVFGYQGQFGASAASPVTVRYDFQSSALMVDEQFIDTNGLRGTRSRDISRVRQGNRRVAGPVRMNPSSLELSTLLPWILGGTPTGSGTVAYPLADVLPLYYVSVDDGATVMTYSGVAIDKWTVRGQQGQALDMSLDMVGQDESIGSSGTFPVLSIDTSTQPFIFTDLVITVGGTPYTAKNFTLVVDNAIDKERFYNSQTLSAVIATDRHVTLTTELPYGTASAVYNTGPGGVAVVATFTGSGTEVLTLSFVKATFPRKSPSFKDSRGEVMLELSGSCYQSAGTRELVTTLHT